MIVIRHSTTEETQKHVRMAPHTHRLKRKARVLDEKLHAEQGMNSPFDYRSHSAEGGRL